jgi:hypothetical protein
MATKCLSPNLRTRIPRFSVVGQYVNSPRSRFVQHVALLRFDEELDYGRPEIRVWHMGPPLVAGAISSASSGEATCTSHLTGLVELNAREIEGIETWLADVDKEDRPLGRAALLRQYTVHPPVFWVTAENGVRLYRRFSCAGFVLDGYRSIGINLIDDSGAHSLPSVDLQTIADAYGGNVRNEHLRERLGIPGNGPWRILLTGYLMHSLNRSDDEIRMFPHVPTSEAEKEFPLA